MLSIIICSKNPKLAIRLKRNIEATVGIPFECIVIDNSTRKYSIFTAYNEGIRRSRFPYLCFLHEDVAFETQDWGKRVCDHLSNSVIGLIGLCGSFYQSGAPASWSLYEYTAYIVQSDKHRKLRIFEPSDGYDEHHEKQAVTMDGVFLGARRELFDRISFDNTTFSGFHAYDLDICVQSHVLGYKNVAVNDILLTHYSKGKHNEKWVRNILLFADKWQDHLPILLGNHSTSCIAERETDYMKRTFLKYLVCSGYSNRDCKHLMINYLSDNSLFIEWVQSPMFDRWLFWMRLKKRPLTLVIPPASRVAQDSSAIS